MFRKYVYIAAGMLAAWLLIASLARAQSHDHDAAAALALAQAGKKQPAKGIDPDNPNVFHILTYAEASAQAVKQRKPLVTFLGYGFARQVPGAVVCVAAKLTGYDGPAIIVAVPALKHAWLDEAAVLPANATDAKIIATWQLTEPVRKAASPVAAPFEPSGKLPRAERDDDLEGFGPWPIDLKKPEGFIRYRRAKRTQEIAVTNDRDRITPVPRTVLEAKYHQSGGMQGLRFRSDVYKLASVKPRVYVGDIAVLNSFGSYQNNRGWRRDYPAGAAFMDVLSNVDTGEVFEVRKLEKHGPRPEDWYAFVDYENPDERPTGYTGKIGVSCGSCHGHAGTGPYAAGLVIGGDMILSDPFPALER